MSKNLENKKVVVEEIKNKIKSAKSVILVNYKGLTVEQDTAFRSGFRKAGVDYKVYKNRLLKIAFNELGIKFPENVYENPTAIAISSDDVIAPAKVISQSMDNFNVITIKSGYVEGSVVDEAAIKRLASIPSREVLIAQFLGMLTMPIRNLAVVLSERAKKI